MERSEPRDEDQQQRPPSFEDVNPESRRLPADPGSGLLSTGNVTEDGAGMHRETFVDGGTALGNLLIDQADHQEEMDAYEMRPEDMRKAGDSFFSEKQAMADRGALKLWPYCLRLPHYQDPMLRAKLERQQLAKKAQMESEMGMSTGPATTRDPALDAADAHDVSLGL
mmetsp:Transcript_17001/g.44235  ORF Transcript_17001/g.44235 Transcript_17001/m.44235 type:complete len:168 (-) Transcript_17001:58-561(-)